MPETILEIIRLSLEITLEVIKGIPIAEREKAWMQHQKNVEFLIAFFSGLLPKLPLKP